MGSRAGGIFAGWLMIALLALMLSSVGQLTQSAALVLIVLGILLYFAAGVYVINEWERIVVLRLGKFSGVRGPGITFVWPIIESVPRKVSLRITQYMFTSERTLTKDNVPITVDAVVYYRVVDPEKAVLNVENYELATQYAAQTSLREVIGKVELDELLTHRELVGKHIQEIMDEKTESWGVKVVSVELRDIGIPQQLMEAIALQARAERERRSRVILAQAEVEAAEKMLQAAQMYLKNPAAMELRWMNILYEIGRENNTLILTPTRIPLSLQLSEDVKDLFKKLLGGGEGGSS